MSKGKLDSAGNSPKPGGWVAYAPNGRWIYVTPSEALKLLAAGAKVERVTTDTQE